MKNLFSAMLLTGLAGAATTARAQSTVEFGPRLGLNVSTVKESGTPDPGSGFSQETKSIVGVQVGATLNVGINDNFSFQPSLIYSRKGAEFIGKSDFPFNPAYKTSIEATATPKIGYLELPLNFVYTFGGHDGFQVFAGPYVAMGVSGEGSAKATINTNDPDLQMALGGMTSFPATLKVEFGDKQNDNANNNNTSTNPGTLTATITVKRFDAGLNAGIGYRVGPFQAQLGYGLGLVNFTPKDTNGNDTGAKSYNRVFQLSANYFFGGK
ncbi:porin family protein [Hymenobacter properus]|uniref:PorT family protein n=1 Tax=Hymenobacter properus TaxID=2791026 RepID=A0A931BFN5_9BACT|nr:porin family protein [Hymenobacter properus]MBF9142594.1 PorT family protein [Hymenobacter properus]MBR7721402.1 PorT family protein [Microvirga sp. SRT04]